MVRRKVKNYTAPRVTKDPYDALRQRIVNDVYRDFAKAYKRLKLGKKTPEAVAEYKYLVKYITGEWFEMLSLGQAEYYTRIIKERVDDEIARKGAKR